MTESLDYSATTPGLGAAPPSTNAQSTTRPQKPCNSAPLFRDWLLHKIRHSNPRYGPVRSLKLDVKDSFYCMFLSALDSPKLAVIMPTYDGEPQLVVLPMACTMGWVQLPPTFCAMSETVCDLANAYRQVLDAVP